MKFIHLSDLHFHRANSDNIEAEKVLDYVNRKYPDHKLIITGDIVDDGHELQFENALHELEKFKGRVFFCPGNHDFGAAGNFFSKERAERFDRLLSVPLEQGGTFRGDNTPVVNIAKDTSDEVMLIALDTNLETDHPFDFSCGEVGDAQLSVLDTILANLKYAKTTKILFFHHHPFVHNNPFMELKDARKLMRCLYNRVDVVLFGHKHVSKKLENCNGIKFVLASDNSPCKDYARQISLRGKKIAVKDIRIRGAKKRVRS